MTVLIVPHSNATEIVTELQLKIDEARTQIQQARDTRSVRTTHLLAHRELHNRRSLVHPLEAKGHLTARWV